MNDQVGDSGAERGDALRRNNVAHAGNAAMLRQNFKQTDGDFDAVSAGNAAEGDRVPAVATNASSLRAEIGKTVGSAWGWSVAEAQSGAGGAASTT